MNILLAFDSFKESMSGDTVADCVKDGLQKECSEYKVIIQSLSDGGEGFIDVIKRKLSDGKSIMIPSVDPVGRDIDVEVFTHENCAYIESAKCVGLELLSPKERNPLKASSYGLGIVISQILDRDFHTIYIGLGGTAVHDCGIPMAEALGFQFYDCHNKIINTRGKSIKNIATFSDTQCHKKIKNTTIIAVTDVNNTLLGKNGAAYMFAPQKGATADMVALLEKRSELFTKIARKDPLHKNIKNLTGGGAAGGLGAGISFFLGGKIHSGHSFMSLITDFENIVAACDIIITGEGALDNQSIFGKVPYTVLSYGKKLHKPVIALVGRIKGERQRFLDDGFYEVLTLHHDDISLEESIRQGTERVEKLIPLLHNIIKRSKVHG